RGGVEAAHVHRIASGGVAVLAGEEGADAGGVAQRFGQRGGGLFLEQVLADHLHRAGGVDQRLVELGGGELAGVGLLLLAVDLDLAEGAGGQDFRPSGGVCGDGGGSSQYQSGEQGGGEGGCGGVGRGGVLAALDEGHRRSVRMAKGKTAPGGAEPAYSITDENRSQ